MDIDLTAKQKKLVGMARARKELKIRDCRLVYSDRQALQNALQRLVIAGILKKTNITDVFEYNQEKDDTILRWLG